ncbi:MAG: ABC transporter substrate-binding protein [Firmicutes bacterium]|nr:ABC transporter substrate-binding protein [Bacillota bacterium]
MKKKITTLILSFVLLLGVSTAMIGCTAPEHEFPYGYIMVHNRFYNEHRVQTHGPGYVSRPVTEYVQVPLNPQRVAVFCHAILDIMLEFDLANRVVGIAHMSTADYIDAAFPRTGANALPDLGAHEPHTPDFETVIAINPDLIIISGRQRARPQAFFSRLSAIAPTIDLAVRTGAEHFVSDFKENVEIIAKIFGLEGEADERLAAIQTQIDNTAALAYEMAVTALIVQLNGSGIAAHGGAGRYSLIHRELGIREAVANVNPANHGTPIGAGFFYNNDADIIFWIDRGFAVGDGASDVNILNHAIFQDVTAVSNNHVFGLNSASWYFVSGGLRFMEQEIAFIYNTLRSVRGN